MINHEIGNHLFLINKNKKVLENIISLKNDTIKIKELDILKRPEN